MNKEARIFVGSFLAFVVIAGLIGSAFYYKSYSVKLQGEKEVKLLEFKAQQDKDLAEQKAQADKKLADQKAAEAKALEAKAKAEATARANAAATRQKNIDNCMAEAWQTYSDDWDTACYIAGEGADCVLYPSTASALDARKISQEQNCIDRY